jgi:hypothetical protein
MPYNVLNVYENGGIMIKEYIDFAKRLFRGRVEILGSVLIAYLIIFYLYTGDEAKILYLHIAAVLSVMETIMLLIRTRRKN